MKLETNFGSIEIEQTSLDTVISLRVRELPEIVKSRIPED